MAASPSPPRSAWVVCGACVRGASHERAGLPNQDAIATWVPPPGAENDPVIVAIADGHGGARHFRSAIGARFTVDTTVELLRSLATRIEAASDAERSRIAAVDVPAGIVGAWNERVRSHLASTPITAAEWAGVEATEGRAALDAVRADPMLAYGTTALAAMVTGCCVVLAQLGDGDILAVAPDGTTTRPLPADERLLGNRTTSICRPGSERDFRCIAVAAGRVPLSLLLLSSDGYANSFQTDEDFLLVGRDLQEMIRSDGVAAVGAQLQGVLEHTSANGSGDDITLGLLLRTGGLGPQRGAHTDSETWGDAVEPPAIGS